MPTVKSTSSTNNSVQRNESRNLQQEQDATSQLPSTALPVVSVARDNSTEIITAPIYTREATVAPLQDNTPEARQEIHHDINNLIKLCNNLKNKQDKTKILEDVGSYFEVIANIKNKYVPDTKIAETLSMLWEDITNINTDRVNITLLHDIVNKATEQLQTLATFYQVNPKQRNIVIRFFIAIKQIFKDCINFIKSLINAEKNNTIVLSEDEKNRLNDQIRKISQSGSTTFNTDESQSVSSNNTNTELEVYISDGKILLSYEEEKYLQDIINQQDDIINIEQLKTTDIKRYIELLNDCFVVASIDRKYNQHIQSIQKKLDQANIETSASQYVNLDNPEMSSIGVNGLLKLQDTQKVEDRLASLSQTIATSQNIIDSQAASNNNANTELELYISDRKILLSYEEEKYLQDIINKQDSSRNIEQLKTTSIAEYKDLLASFFNVTAIDNENNQHIKSIQQKLDQANIENPARQRINKNVPRNLSDKISIAPLNNFSNSCWFNSSIKLLHHIIPNDLHAKLIGYTNKINLISRGSLQQYALYTYNSLINLNNALTEKYDELVIDELQDFLTNLAVFAKKVSMTDKTLFKYHEDFYDAAVNIFNIFRSNIDENYRVDMNAIDQYGVVEFINHIFQFLDFKNTTNSLKLITEETFTIDANSLKTTFSALNIPLEIEEDIITIHIGIDTSTTACLINLFHPTLQEEENSKITGNVNFNLNFLNEYIKKQVTVTSDPKKLKDISDNIEQSQQLNQQLCETTEVSVQKESLTFLQSDNIQELKNFIIDTSTDTTFNGKFPEITTIIHDATTNKQFSVTAAAKNVIVFSGSTKGTYYGHYSSFSIVDDFKDIIVHDDAFQGTLNQFYRTLNTDKSAEFMAEFEKKDLATRLDILMKETEKTPVSVLYEVTAIEEI